MRTVLARIWRHLLELLGVDKMSSAFNILTINYVYLMMYYTFESVFVNTLLYRMSGDMMDIITYRGVNYLMTAVSMNIGALIARRKSPTSTIKLGGFSYILMYVVLFFGMDYILSLKYLIAALSGIGAGFYWTGQTILITHYTTKENRAVGVSIQGIVQGVMTLLVPIISGFFITLMPGSTGYRVMFGICMLVVILQRGYQNKLEDVQIKKPTSEIRLALKLVWKKATCKLMLSYELIRGFRDGTFGFFLNMLLFEIVTDEGRVGINSFLTGAMAILGSWAFGKLSTPKRRMSLVFCATTILMLGIWGQLFYISAGTVMLFSAINAFAQIFIVYAINTYSFNVLGQNETMRQCMAEMVGLREIAINAGRILGLFVVTLFPKNMTGYIYAMLVLTGSQYVAAMLLKITKDILERKERRVLLEQRE